MDGKGEEIREIRIASWERRLGAWLIDMILVGITWDLLVGIAGPLNVFGFWPQQASLFHLGGPDDAIVLFVYWTIMEGYQSQSIGKMALNLRVTDKRGEKIDLAKAAIESFGKAVLLPIDCLIGWIAMPGSGQRLFNRLSDTIVVVDDVDSAPEGVRYVKP